jgi:alkaline phosphatase D
MKISSVMEILTICMVLLVVVVKGNGVPTPEMFRAKSLEEFNRLRSSKGLSINETLKSEVYEQKRRLAKSQPLLASSFGGIAGFYHGVASGDPLPDAVIVWTRYTPVSATDTVTLEFRITPIVPGLPESSHLDPEQNTELRRTRVEVTGASDWIAKIDVVGLPSGTNFIFAFSDGTVVSDIGQTKTAPAPAANVQQLNYAVFSCAHFSNGYFHAYDIASTVKDLDFWIHVGDYVVRLISSSKNIHFF